MYFKEVLRVQIRGENRHTCICYYTFWSGAPDYPRADKPQHHDKSNKMFITGC